MPALWWMTAWSNRLFSTIFQFSLPLFLRGSNNNNNNISKPSYGCNFRGIGGGRVGGKDRSKRKVLSQDLKTLS